MADPEILTIEELLKASEAMFELPALSKQLGQPKRIRARKLAPAEYFSCLPSAPPGSEDWPEEGRGDRERKWLQELQDKDPAAYAVRVQTSVDRFARVVAAASLEPTLTFADAKRLGSDAEHVATEILIFSGIFQRKEPETTAGS